MARNNRIFCKFCYASMWKCLYSVTINPACVPRSTRTCEMLFTDSLWIKCIWTKTTNSLHLSERYSAEFKQTIEINEQPTWYSFRNILIFRCMQSHAEHSAVKWESFFSLITVRSHRRRRERQSGRKSFIFNVSWRRAPARAARRVLDGESGAARFGRWGRRGELKSSQLYGNELWRGSAAPIGM